MLELLLDGTPGDCDVMLSQAARPEGAAVISDRATCRAVPRALLTNRHPVPLDTIASADSGKPTSKLMTQIC